MGEDLKSLLRRARHGAAGRPGATPLAETLAELETRYQRSVGGDAPPPDVAIEPVLSLAAFLPAGRSQVPSILEAGPASAGVSGRTAIAQALECAGLGEGATVMVPAYHCISMIEPLSHVGARPRFYRILPDLSVDLDDIARKLDPSVGALLVTHYFGFPQDMGPLRALCDKAGVALVEDCAHCFFGDVQGRPPGGWGDFATASQRKFFPLFDGGLMIDRSSGSGHAPRSTQTPVQNLKAGFDMIEIATLHGRLRACAPLIRLAKWLRRGSAPAPELAEPQLSADAERAATERGDDPSVTNPARMNDGRMGNFHSAWVGRAPTFASRAVFATVSKTRVVKRRRANYARIAAALDGIPGCTLLRPTLPPGAVPYTLPIRVDNMAAVFPRLRAAAVPIQRFGHYLWPDLGADLCPVAWDLSEHGLQICCHQEMSDAELGSVIARTRTILECHAAAPARPARTAPGWREAAIA